MVILPVAALLLCTSSVLGVGIGVTPGKMAFSVCPAGTQVQALYVINQDSEAADLEVYVEGRNDEWFTITPAKVTLSGMEHKNVEIALTPSLMASPQEYDVSICVISMPASSDLRIGAGIKVSTHVQITKLPIMAIQWWIAFGAIPPILAVGVLVWRRRKTRHL